MAAAVFNLSDINNLMRELQGDVVLYPTIEHIFMESLYPDGIILDAHGRTKAQAEAAEEKFWPDSSRIISSKIPRALLMKNDKGLYICNNLKDELTPFRRGAIAFAKGCNPISDDNWAKYTRQIAPGEVIQMVPIADVVAAIRAKSDTLVVEIGQPNQSAAQSNAGSVNSTAGIQADFTFNALFPLPKKTQSGSPQICSQVAES